MSDPPNTDGILLPGQLLTKPPEKCVVCGKVIETMTYKGTGVCGVIHQKIRDDIPQGDLITSGGWYHTAAKNLKDHLFHEVRFTLNDPFTVYEGTIQHVNWDETDGVIEVVLEHGYRFWNPAIPGQELHTHIGSSPFGTLLSNYRTVEVRRCK